MDMCQDLLFQPLPPHGWWVCVRMHRSLPMVSIYMYSPHTPRWYRIMICCHYSCSPTSVGSICLNKTSIILDDKRKRYVKVRYTDRLQKSTKDSNKVKSNKFNICRWTPKSWRLGVSRLPIEGGQHRLKAPCRAYWPFLVWQHCAFGNCSSLRVPQRYRKLMCLGEKSMAETIQKSELMKLCELYRNIL